MFVGPTAVAFITGEPVDAAKALRDFAKAHPLLVIKGGLLDGRPLEAAEVCKLADLESREVLLGKMAGAMKATLTKAAVVFNALPSQVARLAAALQEKRVADGDPGRRPADRRDPRSRRRPGRPRTPMPPVAVDEPRPRRVSEPRPTPTTNST